MEESLALLIVCSKCSEKCYARVDDTFNVLEYQNTIITTSEIKCQTCDIVLLKFKVVK